MTPPTKKGHGEQLCLEVRNRFAAHGKSHWCGRRSSTAATDAPASPDAGGPIIPSYSLINISRYTSQVNFGQRLTYCGTGTSGTTCTISATYSATRSIGLDLGVTRSVVAAGLSISSAFSSSVSIGCQSPLLQVGQKWAAYPYGTLLYYNVKKSITYTQPTTSVRLTPFSPDGAIFCRVE